VKKDTSAASKVTLLTTREAAKFLKVSLNTLAKWRLEGFGPAFYHVGRRVRYAESDLEDFLRESRRRSTSDHLHRPCRQRPRSTKPDV